MCIDMNVILDLSPTIKQFRQFQLPVSGSTQTDWKKLFLMKYNEREYSQYQCDSVKLKCENQM